MTLRNDRVVKTINEALNRTGHGFLWEEATEEERKSYAKELIMATATFHLLEVVFSISKTETSGRNNPISTLRESMRGRLPEEYFAELLAGWFIEDMLSSKIKNKGFTTELKGADKDRKVLFVRPDNMGDYDLEISIDSQSYLLEVQRVGKLVKNNDCFKTALKYHKYSRGDSNYKILVLWIGKDPSKISRNYSGYFNHLIFIPNIKNRADVIFDEQKGMIRFRESLINSRSISWDELKSTSAEELKEIIKKFTTGS